MGQRYQKVQDDHNTWDSEVMHLGVSVAFIQLSQPEKKENKTWYQRPYVAEASSLFHPDLVLVFPYAIRKCSPAHPTIAMLH